MGLELNRECVEPGEEALFREAARLTAEGMTPRNGHIYRGQHAKATGCVKATFEIREDLPAELQYGVFREPGRKFDAIVRFSNSDGTLEPDQNVSVRGLAIKVLDVAGARVLPDDPETTQDFLMVDHPVFPFPDPKSYLRFMRLRSVPLIGNALVGANLVVFERRSFRILKSATYNQVASPLEDTYWSGAPIWLGDAEGRTGHAVKYSAVPREKHSVAPPRDQQTANYLSEALIAHLAEKEALFDFRIQVQTDPLTMPIENVSVEWNEGVSPPITVATLRIGVQTVDLQSEFARECESMAFTAWHALPEHRPLGGINRMRRVVYEASVERRTTDGGTAHP